MTQIIDSLPFEDIIVWDNSQRQDLSCYGRFAAIAEAKHDYVYVQDDDLLAPAAEIVERYDPERDRWGIVANNRPDEGWPLLGIGSVFHRSLADCFGEYIEFFGFDADFCRIADVVFGYIHPYRKIWLGYTDLPWQTAPNRMYLQPDHYHVRDLARARTLYLQ